MNDKINDLRKRLNISNDSLAPLHVTVPRQEQDLEDVPFKPILEDIITDNTDSAQYTSKYGAPTCQPNQQDNQDAAAQTSKYGSPCFISKSFER